MIRNRLSELLAERHLKISRVANDIEGLSRNTITATAQNKGKMIQLETIDKLCQYLGVQIEDFFEYVPFDVDINCYAPEMINTLSTDNFGRIITDKIKVLPFEFGLFLVKKVNSKDFGTKKKIYELTARISQPFYIDLYEDDTDNPFNKIVDVEILFGQSEEDSNENKSDFDMFISNLSNGIKEIIFDRISVEINQKINSLLKNEGLSEITLHPTFPFTKFTKKENINSYMHLTDNDKPNNSEVDISDDDLPF